MYVLEICQTDTTNEHESEANLISPCMANVIFFQKENILTPSASRVTPLFSEGKSSSLRPMSKTLGGDI